MSFQVILTVEIVAPEERDKFRALSRPDTYRKIRPHEAVGERGCYSVEMTDEEYRQALGDALDPDSNLIAAERALPMDSHLVPNQDNRDYAGLRRLDANDYDASSVVVAVIDRGLSTAVRDEHFAGRIADSSDFTEESDPFSLYGGDPHGCYMAGLAVPEESDLVVAKINLTADVAEALYWLADDTSTDVVSISLGTDTPSTALEDAVEYAAGEGLLIFASMGNDGAVHTNYPAAYDGAYAISNFDHRTDAISPDSTYGSHVWAAAGGNDHTLWNASGAEIYLEAGGTSAATAMATRIAAYVASKFGSGTAISHLVDTAHDAGAPSNKQGVGVLRLVHTREPAIPVVPVGQSRDHGFQLPPLPPIGGPGEGENPSGANPSEEPTGSCADSVLTALVDAYETSGDPSDLADLISYVETERGQDIESLLEPQWSATLGDGATRQKSISVNGCNATFTIEGAAASGGGCTLGIKTMTLDEHDWTLHPVEIGTNPAPYTNVGSPPSGQAGFATTDVLPTVSIHIDDPVMVYVPSGSPLVGRWNLRNAQQIGGTFYYSAIRVKTRYETNFEKKTYYTWDYTQPTNEVPDAEPTQTYIDAHYMSSKIWNSDKPNYGFRSLLRYPEGVYNWDGDPLGGSKAYTDPLELGTASGGTVFSEDYNKLPGDGPSQETRFQRTPRSYNEAFSRDTLISVAGQPEDMDDLVQAEVDAWNNAATVRDAVLSYDSATNTLTVSHETDDNAIYLQGPQCAEGADRARGNLTVIGCGFVSAMGQYNLQDSRTEAYKLKYVGAAVQRLVQEVDDNECFYGDTGWYDRLADSTYEAEITAASASGSTDGRPPDTEPNPPIVPVGGGCRSSIDGPSSCNWNLPDTGEIPLPGDNFPDMPVVDVKFPKFPPIGCQFPDFGNMDPCGPGSGPPGMNGPLPGGRDRRGKRGGNGGVKTGGKSYGNPRKVTFGERTCPGKDLPGVTCFTVITMLLMDCGISPIDIIFQVGAEWDKPFPTNKCFRKGSRIWDAAEWTARFLMLKIIDEGKPTDNIYIGPPWHRPGQETWHFYEHWDLFALDRGFASDELYGYVEVFGPNGSAISFVDSPFVTSESPGLLVEVGANHSQADMNRLAAYKASLIRREATSVQITVPHSSEYMLRDKAMTHAPDRGIEETWAIVGKESDISIAGRFHILTCMLPATLRELDEFPTSVGSIDDEIPGTEFTP